MSDAWPCIWTMRRPRRWTSALPHAWRECLTRDGLFGNPGSSSHEYGEAASERVEAARAEVAAAVGADAAEVIWTSGATEANNLAIFGVAHYYRDAGRHIVTVRTEHKAVLDPCRELERRGWRVTYLLPARDGIVDPAQVAAALRPDTVLVSIMHVNNEIGVIQDIAAIASACAQSGTARLHVDAAQSVGKCALNFAALGIDLLSLSAHKAYGPKGVGALIVSRRRGVQLTPLQYGGGQELALRSGTVATHQVVGMGAAFALAAAAEACETPRIAQLRDRLWERAGRRWAACCATATPPARCLTCSMCRSRTSRERACSRPFDRISPYRRVRPVPRSVRSLPMSCALLAATIVLRKAACASASAAFRREADVDTADQRGAARGPAAAPDRRRLAPREAPDEIQRIDAPLL